MRSVTSRASFGRFAKPPAAPGTGSCRAAIATAEERKPAVPPGVPLPGTTGEVEQNRPTTRRQPNPPPAVAGSTPTGGSASELYGRLGRPSCPARTGDPAHRSVVLVPTPVTTLRAGGHRRRQSQEPATRTPTCRSRTPRAKRVAAFSSARSERSPERGPDRATARDRAIGRARWKAAVEVRLRLAGVGGPAVAEHARPARSTVDSGHRGRVCSTGPGVRSTDL